MVKDGLDDDFVGDERQDILEVERSTRAVYDLLERIRMAGDLTTEDALILIYILKLNLWIDGPAQVTLRPVSIADIGQALQISRETARRKVLALQEKGLLVRTSSGVLVENIGALFAKSAARSV
ncbi:MAG: DeoR family transcriptional regulator [Beijerinckiaceae bacterium]|nr:DeoR family transcriptional regulator [Beijerinckiaceae bacterium]